MSSSFGKTVTVTVFGQSHGEAVGVVIDGLPAGEAIQIEQVQAFLARRAPGKAPYATTRKEADIPVFLSGLVENVTCGAPMCITIANTNARPGDYEGIKAVPRPGHADYTAAIRYEGFADMRGGGHFSGRLTAPLCAAGAVCKQILARRGIVVGAHIAAIAGIADRVFDPVHTDAVQLAALEREAFAVLDADAALKMQRAIAGAADEGDSVGGVIECMTVGMPAGVGSPIFEGVENRLAAALFGIPAVKGLEFGAGFAAAAWKGSQNNDAFCVEDGSVRTKTNYHGGILGGITSGMPIVVRVGVKPTPSIAKRQNSVNIGSLCEQALQIEGRHDPCIVPRAVPCVEAVVAIVLLDMLVSEGKLSKV